MEVWLHSTDENSNPEAPMAVSPNNGAFLLNLTLPVVNFTIVMMQSPRPPGRMKLSVFNITFINDETFADMKLYQTLDSQMLMQAHSQIKGENSTTQGEDLDAIYLKTMKQALQPSVADKL